ncbi:hypothetical protein TanjilG_02820 [Lupinus angustifolius]|uniref:Uncharacterized protein n=1 Tax=Lupinus angustifolius TaxID=3871 RepID=A0A4P1RL17_LUPAN|nr:hypothetical protein TanjilG_02820 [Lupinus angustifolius]
MLSQHSDISIVAESVFHRKSQFGINVSIWDGPSLQNKHGDTPDRGRRDFKVLIFQAFLAL